MMVIGIMQPYLFPYLGYFQLINAVDKFVIHDDVQYIKGGWINRNRLLMNGQARLFTFSIRNDDHRLSINQRFFSPQYEKDKKKFFSVIRQAYSKAPFFRQVEDLLRQILSTSERNVSLMVTNSLQLVCGYIGIETPFIISSQMQKEDSLKGEARIIEINKRLGSTHYINPIGGVSIYSARTFTQQGVDLKFIKMREVVYPQLGSKFVPSLSIVDALMFNSQKSIKELLGDYDLI